MLRTVINEIKMSTKNNSERGSKFKEWWKARRIKTHPKDGSPTSCFKRCTYQEFCVRYWCFLWTLNNRLWKVMLRVGRLSRFVLSPITLKIQCNMKRHRIILLRCSAWSSTLLHYSCSFQWNCCDVAKMSSAWHDTYIRLH